VVQNHGPAPVLGFNPPPPPEQDDLDAGSDAGDAGVAPAPKVAGTKLGGPLPAKPCDACGPSGATGALRSAVSGKANLARGCYQKALRGGGGEGRVVVAVNVGSDGSVCGASVVSDTLNNPSVTSCVLSKFRQGGYPKPAAGCVAFNVPINFKLR